MSTNIRPEISKKNKYWISKHRYYELKHYCLQYHEWQELYLYYGDLMQREMHIRQSGTADPTSKMMEYREYYNIQMRLIRDCCTEADVDLSIYIFKAVTQGLSYVNLKTMYDMPCEKDMYYDRYRKFFWLLSHKKQLLL